MSQPNTGALTLRACRLRCVEPIQVKSVDRAFSAHKDWPAIVDLFATETEIVISNVGESGYKVPDADKTPEAANAIPAGFPAKLLALLLRRHAAAGRKLLVLPCELVTGNGALLRQILLDLSTDWKLTCGFREWLESSILFCDTLVDRIVSAAIELTVASTPIVSADMSTPAIRVNCMQFKNSRRTMIRSIGSLTVLAAVAACGSMNGTGSSANDQLMSAAQAGNVAAIQSALAAGAGVDAFDYGEGRSARTALSYAATNNHPDAIRALVAAGAQVNLANNTGFTALHRAAEAGSVEAAQALLELGADKTLRHGGGFTPSQVAMENNHPELAEILK